MADEFGHNVSTKVSSLPFKVFFGF